MASTILKVVVAVATVLILLIFTIIGSVGTFTLAKSISPNDKLKAFYAEILTPQGSP